MPDVSGGTLTTGTGYVVCGTQNGFLNWTSGTAKLWQHEAGQAGYTYTFKAYAGTHTPGISCSPKLSLIFLKPRIKNIDADLLIFSGCSKAIAA